MTTKTRQLSNIDGANVPTPTQNGFTANGYDVFANDAAYETAYPGFGQGAAYYNSTECIVREYDSNQWVYSQQAYNATEDSTSTGVDQELALEPFNIVRFTEGSLESIIGLDPSKVKILFLSNEQGGQSITLKNLDGGATAGYEILTGTGDDLIIEDGQTIPLVYDGDRAQWLVVGGAGGGAGGLTLSYVAFADSPVTAEIGTHYLTDTTSGVIEINLPEISTIPSSKLGGASIRVSDAVGNWQNNNVNVASGGSDDQIYPDATTDTDVDLDTQGQNVQFNVLTATRWNMDANFQPLETGTAASGSGLKNYILNPDGDDGTSNTTTTGGMGISITETASELPENNTKTKAFKVVLSSGSAGDRAEWLADPIDHSDLLMKSAGVYVRTLGTYADDDYIGGWYNVATSEVLYSSPIKAGQTFIPYGFGIPANTADEEVRFFLEANTGVTDSDGVAVSNVSLLSQSPLVAAIDDDWDELDSPTLDNAPAAAEFDVYYKRQGDTLHIQLFYENSGTSASTSDIEFNIVTNFGLNADESKIPGSGAKANVLGYATFYNTTNYNAFEPLYSFSQSSIKFRWNDSATNADLKANNFGTVGRSLGAKFSVPILEWAGSGTQHGSDLEAANAKAHYKDNSGDSITQSVWVSMQYQTLVSGDLQGQWDGTTFTANRNGFLQAAMSIYWTNAFNNVLFFRAYVNGTTEHHKIAVSPFASNAISNEFGFKDLYLQKGDTVTFDVFHQEGAARSRSTSDGYNWLNLNWVSDKSSTLTAFPLSSQANENKQYLVPEMRYVELDITGSGDFTSGTVIIATAGRMAILKSLDTLVHASSAQPSSAVGFVPEGFRPVGTGATAYNTFYSDTTASRSIRVYDDGTLECIYQDDSAAVNRPNTTVPVSLSYILEED